MASHALKDFKCTTWRLTPVSRWRAAHACVLQAKVVINACSGVWLHTDTSKACDLTANRASWTFAVKSHAFDVSVCNQTPEQAFMTTLACHTCGVKRALNGRHTASVSGAWAARIFSAPMLTNECIHTGSRSSAWVSSRSVVWAALQRWFRHPVYFCCAAHAQIKWQHTFDGQNKYDFTQKLL